MTTESVHSDLLFDANEYQLSGSMPWTFFAYPTSLAGENGLPPDPDACRLLAVLQNRGIEVAVWANPIANNTTYFACKEYDIERLHEIISELENTEEFERDFCVKHSESLFRLMTGDMHQPPATTR